MGKTKEQIAEEEELEGQEPETETTVGENMGEGGQEPQTEKPQEGNAKTEDDGRIDLDALPKDVRAVVEGLIAQVREKNREARNLRKRLKKLEQGSGKASTEGSNEGDDLRKRLEEAERERAALKARLREHELKQAVVKAAKSAGYRPEAAEELEALVRLKLGEDAWDGDKVDAEAVKDFLEELKTAKSYLLKPKPQRKPKPPATPQRKPREAAGNPDKENEIRIRFGL